MAFFVNCVTAGWHVHGANVGKVRADCCLFVWERGRVGDKKTRGEGKGGEWEWCRVQRNGSAFVWHVAHDGDMREKERGRKPTAPRVPGWSPTPVLAELEDAWLR